MYCTIRVKETIPIMIKSLTYLHLSREIRRFRKDRLVQRGHRFCVDRGDIPAPGISMGCESRVGVRENQIIHHDEHTVPVNIPVD